ncbi:MAG: AbrB/MazE/SpoVT family DNA-binding domain-containing protein [Nitrospiraceae bacterium]|nr:AbrB/MazE/SpoVT family DNA-binding domain-containing protein [Nitrospiraceae bacterium]
MGTAVKISPSGQVRIPKEIMKALSVSQGDYIDFEVQEGKVNVRGKRLMAIDQAWFWTKEWQEAEREAERDIMEGRISQPLSSAEEVLGYLKKVRKSARPGRKKAR